MAWRVFLYDFQGACSDMKLFVACVLACMISGTATFAQEPFIVLQYGPSDGPATQSAEGHTIRKGETLSGILRHYFGADAHLKDLVRETVQGNPHAFRGGNADRMLMGQTLRLPSGYGGTGEVDDIYFF